MKYAGVDVDNPRIVAAIKNLAAQGKDKQYISKVVGMPYEIVDKYTHSGKKKK